ncbi:MAG: hypothetical protein VX372_03490 [Verrucomicrobiota bacterium]|nr:hypothetical protein [Verrucomicrobiota bacterium]
MTRAIIACVAWLLYSPSINAVERVRGGLILHEVVGQVDLKELGKVATRLRVGQMPITTMGLIECEAHSGSSAFFTASNRTAIYFEGSGSFAVERFEQVMPQLADWNTDTVEASQSWMRLSFREGDIIVDNRNMLESSQFLVETPIGRLATKEGLWQMRILFEGRSQIFDFTITCTVGRIRFTDLQGHQYTLRAGQRLSGAGSRMTPSIEVGKTTKRSHEQMHRFQYIASQHSVATNDFTQYLDHLQVIEHATSRTSAQRLASRSNSIRRPIVIEYAKEPEQVTPFRGKVKPPSANQLDLF